MDYAAKAAWCRSNRANEAESAQDRTTWRYMEQFWLRKAEGMESPPLRASNDNEVLPQRA
jgi:hypothetical protein